MNSSKKINSDKGKRIKEIRNNLKITQKEFASRIGMDTSNLSTIESGKRNIGPRIQDTIEREFHINPNWLECGTGEMFIKKEALENKKIFFDNDLITIGLQKIDPDDFIQWGKVHILDTQQGIIIKELQPSSKGDDYIKCVSSNESFDIKLTNTIGLYLVIGSKK